MSIHVNAGACNCGGKAHFGHVAGFKPGKSTLTGHFHYYDRGAGIDLKPTEVTGYESGSGNCRILSGTGPTNGQSVSFTVTSCDNGEPGRADTFSIRLSNGYSASGSLAGGNIQLHT